MQLGKKKLGEKVPANTIAPDFSDDDDDDTISSLKENLRENDDDDKREEYGRKLQAALNEETKDLSSGKNSRNPIPMSTFYPPSRNGLKSSVQPSVQLESNDDVVELPAFEEGLERTDIPSKSVTNAPRIYYIFCLVDFFFAIFGLGLKIWWLGVGVLFAPIGFFGFFRLHKRLILLYIIYLVTNILIELIFALLYRDNSLAVILTMLIVAIQAFILFFGYRFYQILPD